MHGWKSAKRYCNQTHALNFCLQSSLLSCTSQWARCVPLQVAVEYFDIGAMGRGEVVRAYLAENKIPFEDNRVPFDDKWPAKKAQLVECSRSPAGSLPVVDIGVPPVLPLHTLT